MRRKQKEKVEFRYYEIPQSEPLLALMGDKWKQVYGRDIDYLHFHNLLEIGYCYYGEGDIVLDSRCHRFSGKMLTIIPKNILHTTVSDKDDVAFWEYLFIDVEEILGEHFKGNPLLVDELQKEINKKASISTIEESSSMVDLIQLIFKEMKDKKEFYLEKVKLILISLLLTIARINQEKSHVIKGIPSDGTQIARALDYVSVYYNKDLRVENLAEECHISETHFRRLFVESMNMTPVDYINLVRIQAACNLILKTNLSMGQIAERVGYQTLSTFYRNFKKFTDLSPYKWYMNSDSYEGKLHNYKISAHKGW